MSLRILTLLGFLSRAKKWSRHVSIYVPSPVFLTSPSSFGSGFDGLVIHLVVITNESNMQTQAAQGAKRILSFFLSRIHAFTQN